MGSAFAMRPNGGSTPSGDAPRGHRGAGPPVWTVAAGLLSSFAVWATVRDVEEADQPALRIT